MKFLLGHPVGHRILRPPFAPISKFLSQKSYLETAKNELFGSSYLPLFQKSDLLYELEVPGPPVALALNAKFGGKYLIIVNNRFSIVVVYTG